MKKSANSISLMALGVSFMVHLIFMTMFYVAPTHTSQFVPEMTKISFLPLDRNQKDFQEENHLGESRGEDVSPFLAGEFVPDAAVTDNPTQFWEMESVSPKPGSDESALEGQGDDSLKTGKVEASLSTQRKVLRLYYPQYPQWARRLGLESEVKFRFEILENGQVGRVFFEHMSGYPELDVVALRAVRKWTFETLDKDVKKQQWGTVKLSFKID